jgi:glycerol-3-phosphate acyltransferase PlsY
VARWYFADGMRSNRQMKMKKPSVQTLLQATACLLCAIVAAEHSDLAYIEFGGGTLTGPLVDLNNIGGLLFIVALILTFIYRRLAAICALVASLLCLPLYLYRMAPGIAQRLIPGSFRYLSRTNFVWNEWAFIGVLLLVMTAYVCFRSFRHAQDPAGLKDRDT